MGETSNPSAAVHTEGATAADDEKKPEGGADVCLGPTEAKPNKTSGVPTDYYLEAEGGKDAGKKTKADNIAPPNYFMNLGETEPEKKNSNLTREKSRGTIPADYYLGAGQDEKANLKESRSRSATIPADYFLGTSENFDGGEEGGEPSLRRTQSNPAPGAHSVRGSDNTAAPRAQTTENEGGVGNAAGDNNQLVEARPVSGDENPDMTQAQPVEEEELRNQDIRKKEKQKRTLFLVGIILLVLALSIGLGVGIGIEKRNSNAKEDNTPVPSTLSPTQQDPLQKLLGSLPDATQKKISNNETVQSQAWEWLVQDYQANELDPGRLVQRFAMAVFFFAFDGPFWPEHKRQHWLNTSMHECFWINTEEAETWFIKQTYGAAPGLEALGTNSLAPCNKDGKVQRLPFMSLDLSTASPFVPPEVALLSSLTALYLPNNAIANDLSFLLPPELSELENLTMIELTGNDLQGSIPQHIGTMTSLEVLGMGRNPITGNLPSQLGLLTGLSTLLLYRCELSGTLPTELGLMTTLTALRVWRNGLTGPVPTEVGLLTDMEYLRLQENSLSGTIPSELGLWSSADGVYLQKNQMNGTIPTELGRMTNTSLLDFAQNAFDGPLPSEIGLMTKLTFLSTHSMGLTGAIPTQLGSLTKMTYLALRKNLFNSTIPSQLGLLTDMERFWTNGNLHTGEIPSELGQWNVSKGVWFDGNQNLTGTIPSGLWEVPSLKLLDLRGLPLLSGTVPDQKCFLNADASCEWRPGKRCSLQFDCTDLLCGCDCPCFSANTTDTNTTNTNTTW